MQVSLMRWSAALFGAVMLAMALMPMGTAAAASKSDVKNGEEAWFLNNKEPLANSPTGSDPTCDLPTGCNASGNAQRSSPHPEGVMVVAANGGDPDAQMFFNFNTDDLPLGAVVTGGTVTMPVAQDPDARNFREDQGQMVACLATGFIPSGADGGSYQDRPDFDKDACVKVDLVEDAEATTYTFDLKRFGKIWAAGTQSMNGVTVMVDPEISPPAPDETWRVVFNTVRRSNDNSGEDAAFEYPIITSDLQYRIQATPGFPAPDDGGFPDSGTSDDGGFPPPDTSGGGGGFDDGGGGFDSGAAPTGDTGTIDNSGSSGEPAVDEPVAAEEPAPQAAGPAVPAGAQDPGTSAAVWVVPLMALIMAGALGWSLTQPVELAGAREGAVSKLMKSRRLAATQSDSPT